MLIYYILPVVTLIIGVIVTYLVLNSIEKNRANSNRKEAERILKDAEKEAAAVKKERLVEAKDEIFRMKSELEKEFEDRRKEVGRQENRLQKKEENIDRKMDQLEKRDRNLTQKESDISKLRENLLQIEKQHQKELERVAGMNSDQARELLLSKVEKELENEISIRIKRSEEKIKEISDQEARRLISLAIQKWASEQVVESTISVVSLPNDDMKGRIIGREGRNIRALETATGIDLIIDDTPEAVILSGFDPIRREIARMALEKLITDGRIHPARIEEMVDKAKKDMEQRIKEEGEQAMYKVGVSNLHPEVVKMLGRLRFRTSYGQNVLQHSVEVAVLAGIIATELGMDPEIAKRSGLLHDLGKAMDAEMEGTHALLGARFAEKYKESPDVVHAIAAHHEDEEQRTIEAVLIQACDAISAARPGARRETLETYIKRLEKLEKVANSFEGVEKSFAIQAGREVRIMVKPEKIDDITAARMARDVVKKIEEDMDYPGQIKVTVIRETRAVEYAK
ncbi:MAG: ribonuclease Y [Chloroflexi bacterium]|nr:ribonuclease Y [Chloroflexota bacterium]